MTRPTQKKTNSRKIRASGPFKKRGSSDRPFSGGKRFEEKSRPRQFNKDRTPTDQQRGGRWEHLQNLWNGWVRSDSELLPQVDRYLAAELKKNKKFGSQDRRWYSEWVFAAIRYWTVCLPAYELEQDNLSLRKQLKKVPAQKVFAATRQCMAHFTPDNPALTRVPGEMSFDSGKLTEVLSTFKNQDVNSLFDLVLGFENSFKEEFQKRRELSSWNAKLAEEFLLQQLSKSPFWVRLNHPDKKEEVLKELTEAGYTVVESGEALHVAGSKAIYGLNSWNQGHIEIQDAASQQLSDVLETKPGQIVWDACAGGGGKTMSIAARLQNKGAVYASDIREYKLLETKRRAKKAAFHNVRTFPWDGSKPPKLSLEVHRRGGFDSVFVDAPCSSLGTMRRNPDARVRLSRKEIVELTKIQQQLLTQASRVVKVGGALVYATCSWLPSENEDVVNAFLESAEGKAFTLEKQQIFGCPDMDSDTMFAARLVRSQP